MPDQYDVAIVGGGSGGYVAAIRAAQLGLRAVLVEEDKVGGTCLHRGCIPTKALLQSASLLDAVNRGKEFGVTVGSVSFEYPTAAKRRDGIVAQLHKGVEGLLRKNKVAMQNGKGRIIDPQHVEVTASDGTTSSVQTKTILLATGSRPRSIPGLAIDGKRVITSDDALKMNSAPASVIVLGAGAVGVEFASFYRSVGSTVTLVEMADHLVPLEDEAVGVVLQKQFEARGIKCLVSAKLDVASVKVGSTDVAVTIARDGKEEQLRADVLLVAIGRSANTEGLGLEGTRVKVEKGTVVVDGSMATGEAGIYGVGDLVGGFWLAHKAMHEGVIAAEAIAGKNPHPLDPNLVTRTTYCTPQIASMGLTEAQARAQGHDVGVGVMPFAANGRALIWGEPGGFCKMVTDKTRGDILGVHMIGPEVTELIFAPALGALLESTPFEISRAVAPHPTLSEVLGEAALAVSGEAIHI